MYMNDLPAVTRFILYNSPAGYTIYVLCNIYEYYRPDTFGTTKKTRFSLPTTTMTSAAVKRGGVNDGGGNEAKVGRWGNALILRTTTTTTVCVYAYVLKKRIKKKAKEIRERERN